MQRFEISFYAANGTQIGHARKRHCASFERAVEIAADLAKGIDNRTRRQTAGTDSRKVARTEIVEVSS